ncbi:MAG: S41 family peptidase [Planctomycetaceae bacterium]|nr:S41 family peptidase [Planctomycetaceae bacterium]
MRAWRPTTRRNWLVTFTGLARTLALAFALFLLVTAAQAQPGGDDPITDEQKAAVLESARRLVEQRAFAGGVSFATWEQKLAERKDRIDRATTVGAFSREVNRLLNEYGISHIDLVTPTMAQRQREDSMVGIGIRHSGFTGGPVTIDQIIKGGPAEKAGLKPGDVIQAVDGAPLGNVAMLRGEEGSKVVLEVKRGDEVFNIEVTRAKFSTRDPAELIKVNDETAMLVLPTFDRGYDRDSVENLFREAAQYKSLIIDLRGNGGGAVTNLYHFLGMLLPRGAEFGTSVNKEVAEEYQRATGGDPADVVKVAEWHRRKWTVRRNAVPPFTGRVAVLINRASASASEIATAALVEVRDPPAITVGTRTAGAVLVANDVSMPEGFRMRVPVSDYVTIKGRRLEGNPWVAQIQIQTGFRRDSAIASDRVVAAAVKALAEVAAEEANAALPEKKE